MVTDTRNDEQNYPWAHVTTVEAIKFHFSAIVLDVNLLSTSQVLGKHWKITALSLL